MIQKSLLPALLLSLIMAELLLVATNSGAVNTSSMIIDEQGDNNDVNDINDINKNEHSAKPSKQHSHQFAKKTDITRTLNQVLPSFSYSTENLSSQAQRVNQAIWQKDSKIDHVLGTKIQALLNWHHHGVGAVDGYWGKNTRKAMQAFQQTHQLPVTDNMNEQTWLVLTQDSTLAKQPVLINYQLTNADVNIKTVDIPEDSVEKSKLEGLYYQRVTEALAEKFHMDEGYLKALNKDSKFEVGDIITVYNPAKPNNKAVSRVLADKQRQTLYAYDANGDMVASYPTTVGSSSTPSPTGIHKVKVKIYEPNYTYTHDDGRKYILAPGANNPVGLVWIGLSKPTYGIHGSPDPERISRQASSGCIRLTNWDALALYATIDKDATVEFK